MSESTKALQHAVRWIELGLDAADATTTSESFRHAARWIEIGLPAMTAVPELVGIAKRLLAAQLPSDDDMALLRRLAEPIDERPIEDGTCECGCGEAVTPGKRFIRGHQLRIRENRARTSCSAHCSICQTCFTGTASFDAHLVRSAVGPNEQGASSYELVHLTPEEAGLEAAVTAGSCTLSTPELEGTATVWRIPLGYETAEAS